MPQNNKKAKWPPPKTNDKDILVIKNNLQKILKNWTNCDQKLFADYLATNNIKEYLIESRSILKKCAIDELSHQAKDWDTPKQITCITINQINDLAIISVIRWTIVETAFGQTFMAVLEQSLCAIFFIEKNGLTEALIRLQKQWPNVQIKYDQDAALPFVTNFENSLIGNNGQNIPIILKGTKFQVTIWKMLLNIPYGLVISYGDLAGFVENTGACRAVGTAVGQNPIAYLIPCHRVINSSGVLGQYHWGSEKKRAMLAFERTTYKQHSAL